jgi:hypothetical protein
VNETSQLAATTLVDVPRFVSYLVVIIPGLFVWLFIWRKDRKEHQKEHTDKVKFQITGADYSDYK